MHIFHVITTLNKGGAETHLVELCRGLSRRGVALTVAFLKGDGFWAPELQRMGVRTVDLAARHYADPGAIGRLARAIAAADPDLVHAHMPPAELYVNACRLLGQRTPLVTSKHNDSEPFYRGVLSRQLEMLCAAPAAAVICISEAVRKDFSQRWPERLRRKLLTVRYGLDPAEGGEAATRTAAGLRSAWGVGDGDVLFGIAARLVEQKAVDSLLQAFALLRRDSAVPVKLAIVGQGPLEGELRALSDRLGIAADVIWAGFHTEIPVVMRAFDVFVLSSIYEGFGLVLLEAMEASTPIVATRISAIPEIVVDSETGLLVPAREPALLAQAMGKMLDGETRQAMGSAGRRRLLEAFGTERMIDETLAVYEAALARPVAAADLARQAA